MTKDQLHRGVLVINKHADQIGIIIKVNQSYKAYEVLWFLHCGRLPVYSRRRRRNVPTYFATSPPLK